MDYFATVPRNHAFALPPKDQAPLDSLTECSLAELRRQSREVMSLEGQRNEQTPELQS